MPLFRHCGKGMVSNHETVIQAGAGELPMAAAVKGFQKSAAEYAEMYGSSVRTIKSWKTRGRKVGAMPPLDNPVSFVRWWSTYQKQRVPEKIATAAANYAKEHEEKECGNPLFFPPKINAAEFKDVAELNDGGLAMMRQMVQMNGKAWAKAMASGKDAATAEAESRYQKSVNSLRALEKTQADMAKSSGGLISRDEVAAKIGPRLVMLGDSVLEGMVQVAMRANEELTRAEARVIAVEQRDKCFKAVKGSLL